MIHQLSGASRASALNYTATEPNDIHDTFDGSGSLDSALWNTYNPSEPAITVTRTGGHYNGAVTGAGQSDTTWFDGDEGQLHYQTFTGDFEVIYRNIGILSGSDPGTEFQFVCLVVWLSANNWEFAGAGNRGSVATNTIEYKSTVASSSAQNDIGTDAITNDKCDMRVTRVGSTVNFYYQQPGTSPDSWTLLPHSSLSHRVSFGTGAVRVGIATYGFSFPTDFVGTCDQVEIPVGTPTV